MTIEEIVERIPNTINIIERLHQKTTDILKVNDIENIIKHSKSELENIIDIYPNQSTRVFNIISEDLNEVKQEIITNQEDGVIKNRKIYFLDVFTTILNNLFSSPNIENSKKVRLRINAPKNVVYDLLRQLKNLSISGDSKILPQTNDDLALFLIQNVEGYENIKQTTIATALCRHDEIAKAHLNVKIVN